MKKNLLILSILISNLGFSQVFLNEIMLDPPGADRPHEYIELRGPASGSLDNMYVVIIEGDAGTTAGRVRESIDLNGETIGTNGLFVIVESGNTYPIDAGANTMTIAPTTGDLTGQSHTIMLIETMTPPAGQRNYTDGIDEVANGSPDDIDSDQDGIPDGTVFAGWTVIDSFSFLRDNSGNGIGYAPIGFIEDDTAVMDPTFITPAGSTYITTTGTQYDYAARLGNSTGNVLSANVSTTDWIGGNIELIPTMLAPNWRIDDNSSRATPTEFAEQPLTNIGAENPAFNILSITENEIAEGLSFYPNPTSSIININSKNDRISSIEVVDVTGQILVQKNDNFDVLDLTSLSTGLYYMNIYGDGAKISRAIVKN